MRKYLTTLFLILAATFVSLSAYAATLSFSGSPTNLQFGTLQIPSSGSHTFTVSATGGTSGTGTLVSGTPSNAQVRLKRTGRPAGTISIDIQNINTGNPNLTLSAFTGRYGTTNISSFPVGGLSDPGTGSGTALKIGATATYNSSISSGALTPTFDVVAVFE